MARYRYITTILSILGKAAFTRLISWIKSPETSDVGWKQHIYYTVMLTTSIPKIITSLSFIKLVVEINSKLVNNVFWCLQISIISFLALKNQVQSFKVTCRESRNKYFKIKKTTRFMKWNTLEMFFLYSWLSKDVILLIKYCYR